jgi:hypothetical protein
MFTKLRMELTSSLALSSPSDNPNLVISGGSIIEVSLAAQKNNLKAASSTLQKGVGIAR